ncbi:hypothetical protein Pint_08024 [Pistacia integerrima]|uniref:Uncharacterized protein n=1 Tax=Pistacia integerrima TaxID=434235 RepID=A0ACC0XYE5_9ROSI|nr:hypothetical protein Pint_08024 [Pistacia integerrima]
MAILITIAYVGRHLEDFTGFIIFFASDTRGGNALNVQRTIKDLIAVGAAGCFLEVLLCYLVSVLGSYPCGRNNFIPNVQPELCP